ncbi:MAG: UpxY family transcription antiterminator [Bacteroidales bacterium]|nr:UpxY family transcription antiterminator [Bacteroidales bacterium]
MLTSEPQWVAIYTNPRWEKKTADNLRRAGYEVYLPLRRELHSWSDRKKWVEVPLIKSYVFAKLTIYQEIPIRNIPGVAFLVKFKQNVAVIPDNEIQMMKDFIAAEVAVQIRSTEMLQRGRHVRINSGALEGREGLLVSDCEEGNFAVEITGISMAMIVNIDQNMLDVVENDPEATVKTSKKVYNIR